MKFWSVSTIVTVEKSLKCLKKLNERTIIMANTRDETIRQTTQAYLQTIDPDNLPDSDEITGEILDQCEQAIFQINATRQTKWKVLHNLIRSQIADIILHCHKVRSLTMQVEKLERI